MADIISKSKRSAVMARIRGAGNRSTELRLIAVFREVGIKGWRRGAPIIGRPDFVFPRLRIAVFVDGCFWHGCPKHATSPKSNVAFWRRKFAANKARDLKVNRTLRADGWRVLRIWEHELVSRDRRRLLRRLRVLEPVGDI